MDVLSQFGNKALLDIGFLCNTPANVFRPNYDSHVLQPIPHPISHNLTQAFKHQPQPEEKLEVAHSWQGTIDIHLGHKIVFDNESAAIAWNPEWNIPEQQSAVFCIAPRWIIKDPSRPGEFRDCTSCLSGRHIRKFVRHAGRPVALFSDQDEEPALRLDTFGQTQIKQWCKDILKVDKKPKESFLCFDLCRFDAQNKIVVEKRNVITFKTNLKGYRFSKSAPVSTPHSKIAVIGKRTREESQSDEEDNSSSSPTPMPVAFIAPFIAQINSCAVEQCDPLPWNMFEDYMRETFAASLGSDITEKIASVLGKVWTFKNNTFQHYMDWKAIKQASTWAGSFVNFVRICFQIFSKNSSEWFHGFIGKRNLINKLSLQKDGTYGACFCTKSLSIHLFIRNSQVPEGFSKIHLEISREGDSLALVKKGSTQSYPSFAHLLANIAHLSVSSEPSLPHKKLVNERYRREMTSTEETGPCPKRPKTEQTPPVNVM
jgi:hypothetical protein